MHMHAQTWAAWTDGEGEAKLGVGGGVGGKGGKHWPGAEKFYFISTSLLTPWGIVLQKQTLPQSVTKSPCILWNPKV